MAGNALTMKEPAGRPVGRPRCMETQQTTLAAAADLLESQPYRDISVERIAAQAGVGKQTIYRWYDSKADLMLDAFLARYAEIMPPAMLSGDPLGNLRDYLHHLVEVLPTPGRGPPQPHHRRRLPRPLRRGAVRPQLPRTLRRDRAATPTRPGARLH